MATSLRAFLMMRSKSREWSIQVYRDLEELIAGWHSRPEPNESVAVMHIGFDRPLANEFDEVVDQFAGKSDWVWIARPLRSSHFRP